MQKDFPASGDKTDVFIDLLAKFYNKEIPIMMDKISSNLSIDYTKDYFLYKAKKQVERLFYANVIKNIMNNLHDLENMNLFGYTESDVKKIQIQEEVLLKTIKNIDFSKLEHGINEHMEDEKIIGRKEYQLFANSIKKISKGLNQFMDYFEDYIQLSLCETLIEKQEDDRYKKFLEGLNFTNKAREKLISEKEKENCPHCGGKNFVSVGLSSRVERNINDVEISFGRNFYCNDCYKYFYSNYLRIIDNYEYSNCEHNKLEAAYMPVFDPSLIILCKVCMKCGKRLISCEYLKEQIDKYYPMFWNKVDKHMPYEFRLEKCSYCLGEDATNKLEEAGHTSLRALSLCKNKNPELFNYFFETTNTPEVVKVRSRTNLLYDEIKSIEWGGLLKSLLHKKKLEDKKKLRKKLFQEIADKEKLFNNYIREASNYYREKFDLPLIGEKWISETTLFKLIKQIYKDKEVVFHSRPNWLQGLELDIYIPEERLAIEYMGKQHYEPVSFFGGEESFLSLVERDKRKKDICIKNDIVLIHFDYRMAVSKESILKLIQFTHKV